MKISNSKKQLANIIHENGGWRDDAESAAQCAGGEISFWYDAATKRHGEDWRGSYLGSCDDIEFTGVKLPNWHQTLLSRDEYFHLYPVANTAPDADVASLSSVLGLVTDENKHEHVNSKPSIEQLASDYRNRKDFADRKQQEADDAKADAEVKLAELVAAGKALGLVLSVADVEPELVITDWRDLRIGDIIECPDYADAQFIGEIIDIDAGDGAQPIALTHADGTCTWPSNWRFIRRPAQGGTNA